MNAHPPPSPEPLPLLLAALPSRVLFEIIKADAPLCQTVFQGFTVRPASLAHAPVRQRLEQTLARYPELATLLFNTWQELFADLVHTLNAPEFSPSPETLVPLRRLHGESSLQYALLHADREEVRAWAGRLAEIIPPAPSAKQAPPPAPAAPERSLRQQQALQALQAEHEEVKRKLTELRQQHQFLSAREAELRKQSEAAEARADREQRRARRAEEQVTELRRLLRQAEAQPAPAEHVSATMSAILKEAIVVLQRGLARVEPVAPAKDEILEPPMPVHIPPVTQPAVTPAIDPTVTLPLGRTKQTIRASRIREALIVNDADFLQRVRDGLARLAKDREQERAALATLDEAGIPRPLLTGPLHPAVVDGSNIANMSRASRGKLAYLQQVRRAAWEEGYFPVLIIVDASLRHQIDQPELLMIMVERGEIQMAPPGTSADVLLIEEAAHRHAVLLTNDRMADWPTARKLDKRHVEIDRDTIRLGGFHNSARWF